MRKTIVAGLLAFGVLVSGAGAITSNGFPDNGLHPNVGGVLTRLASGDYALVCSGTLVSETVVVTASHCAAFFASDPRPDFVTFDETAVEDDPDDPIPATAIVNPSYKHGVRNDVSIMVLSEEVTDITPAALPGLGDLDGIPFTQSTRLTMVGYGTQEKQKGTPSFPFTGDRWYGIGGFNALTPQWLKISQNAAHGDSGACFGDSGGPVFLGAAPNDGEVVLAVTSTGDIPCYSTNVASRTDTESARDFLSLYVP